MLEIRRMEKLENGETKHVYDKERRRMFRIRREGECLGYGEKKNF